MRRMYSEQELTNVIKKVFEEELESGALDELVSDAVDAYLVEHPVDITALEGQTINPARIDVANINGESDPSVKPIYYHGIYLSKSSLLNVNGLILNNSSTAIDTATKFKNWIEGISGVVNFNCNGYYIKNGVAYQCFLLRKNNDNTYTIFYNDGTSLAYEDYASFDDLVTDAGDAVNKIN